MNLPASIRVACYDIRIEQWNAHAAAAARRYGEFSSIEMVIRIDENIVSRVRTVDTFIHEVMHAIFWAYGVQDEDKEERLVSVLGTAWTQVHRDNPWLMRWIGEMLA